MEDPWASSAWSTPAKPSANPEPTTLPSNPWGAPTTPAGSSTTTFENDDKTKSPTEERALGLSGWEENAWGAKSEAATQSLPTLPTNPIKAKVETDPDPGAVWGGDPALTSPVPLPGSPKASSKSAVDLAAAHPLPETPELSASSAVISYTLPKLSLTEEEIAIRSQGALEGDHGPIWGDDPTPVFSAPPSEEMADNLAVSEPISIISNEAPIMPPLVSPATGLPTSTSHNSLNKTFGEFGSSPVKDRSNLILPKSPSFGEEFGGFSDYATPAASNSDPWRSGMREDVKNGWGNDDWEDTSLTKSTSGVFSAGNVIEEREAKVDEEGAWGAPPVGLGLGTSSVTKLKEEDDWEEAQRRIRVQEERAASILILILRIQC